MRDNTIERTNTCHEVPERCRRSMLRPLVSFDFASRIFDSWFDGNDSAQRETKDLSGWISGLTDVEPVRKEMMC
jgi:hypothetical protein